MPTVFASSTDFLHHSSLLLQARPTTTKTTIKYKLIPAPSQEELDSIRSKKRKRGVDQESKQQQDEGATALESKELVTRAKIVLRTYDPESGVCLKYTTDKQAEVGRLISGLGRLGRGMAALPMETVAEKMEGIIEEGVDKAKDVSQVAKDKADDLLAKAKEVGASGGGQAPGQQGSGGGGGGGKKKKKGKK